MRSGRWFLIRSYSRRPCFGGLGFFGLSVGGSFAALGLVVGGFLQAALVFFGPVPTFLGSGKVCWKVILLGESAGIDPSSGPAWRWTCRFPRRRGGEPYRRTSISIHHRPQSEREEEAQAARPKPDKGSSQDHSQRATDRASPQQDARGYSGSRREKPGGPQGVRQEKKQGPRAQGEPPALCPRTEANR